MALSFSVFNKFKAIDEVSAPVRKMGKSVDKFGNKAQSSFRKADRSSNKFAKSLKRGLLGAAAAVVGISAIGMAFTSVINSGVQFEQTIVNASAKFGDTARRGTKNFKALEQAARKAGATTEFAATEAAAGLDFLALAGFNVEQSIAALPGTINLATASGLDLARATDIATDTLGAFNLQTKDTIQLQKNLTRVNDVLAKATTSSNTNMEQLFDVFTEAGPVATSLGASIETVAAMAGRLADAGIKSSQAGTTLKNVFVRLAAATPQAQKQLDKLGVSVSDQKGNFRDVFDILDDLNGSLSKLGEVERAAVLNDIFGRIPIAGVNILLKTGSANLRDFRKQLEAAGGASKAMADTMRATTGVQLKIFMSTLESLKLNIFAAMSDSFGVVIEDFTDLVRIAAIWVALHKGEIATVLTGIIAAFGYLGSVIKFVATSIGTLLEVWGPALAFVGSIIIAMKAWAVIQAVVNTLMAMNPIGLFIIALGAATLGIKAIMDNWDMLVVAFKEGMASIMNSTAGKFFMKIMKFSPLGLAVAGTKFAIDKIKGDTDKATGTPLSPNAGVTNTLREERNNRSTVDVNLNGLPEGSTVEQKGSAAGFKLQTGFAGAT